MGRVGQSVKLAVEKFVSVGESIAEEHEQFRSDMCQACTEARRAGAAIQQVTECNAEEQHSATVSEKTAMVRSARLLLSAITRVLIIADKVVIRNVIAAKNQVHVCRQKNKVLTKYFFNPAVYNFQKVKQSLGSIEKCSTFTDFVKAFGLFGKDMIELARLSGERQSVS